MRIFIAIDFEDHKYFENLQEQIPKDLAKLSLASSFHFTLKFLGEIDKVEDIKNSLKKIKFQKFKIEFSHIGFFPSENYIRIVWIGLKDNEKTIQLQQNVDNVLSDKFKKDRKFHPHVTLARVKFVTDKENFVKKLTEIKVEKKEFLVDKFKLIKSTLTPEGPVYEDLAKFNFS